MTDNTKMRAMAKIRGITVEELRAQYSAMGKKSLNSERAKELQKKSVEARNKKRGLGENEQADKA